MLKVHVHESIKDSIRKSLLQVLKSLLKDDKVQFIDSLNDADVVMVYGLKQLEEIHTFDRHFILILELREKAPAKIPENVVVTTVTSSIADVVKALGTISAVPAQEKTSVKVSAGAKRVLVIEDSQRHILVAKEQLRADYNLTVATNYRQALKAVQQPYDAVLTDLMLPASSETLGPQAIEKYVGEEMPLGLVLVFLAAQAGTKRIGVVTDLNHHAHPVSAALDHLRQSYTVSGATVVFSNTAITTDGKNWRHVLEGLLEE